MWTCIVELTTGIWIGFLINIIDLRIFFYTTICLLLNWKPCTMKLICAVKSSKNKTETDLYTDCETKMQNIGTMVA